MDATTIIKGGCGCGKAILQIDRAADATIQARRNICRECLFAARDEALANRPSKGLRLWSRCTKAPHACGCFIGAKTAIKSEACPEGKWGAEAKG